MDLTAGSWLVTLYLPAWALAVVGAAAVAIRTRRTLGLLGADYRRFLQVRWRLTTFVVAAVALTAVAPYTGDPTWDYVDAAFMSVLTFSTAPWVVGALFRAVRGRALRSKGELYVALAAWFFSASGSYDLYILVRDGHYPPGWLENIGASSILYLAAGLFWALDWRPGRGVTFAFLDPGWPAPGAQGHFAKLWGYGLAFMALVTVSMAYVFLLGPEAISP